MKNGNTVYEKHGFLAIVRGAGNPEVTHHVADVDVPRVRQQILSDLDGQIARLRAIRRWVREHLSTDQEHEVAEWSRHYGSAHLKDLVGQGWDYYAVYRDERLALDRPGWVWSDSVPGKRLPPRNPPVGAVRLLERARKVDASAQLWYTVESGYIAVADFLDREVALSIGDVMYAIGATGATTNAFSRGPFQGLPEALEIPGDTGDCACIYEISPAIPPIALYCWDESNQQWQKL